MMNAGVSRRVAAVSRPHRIGSHGLAWTTRGGMQEERRFSTSSTGVMTMRFLALGRHAPSPLGEPGRDAAGPGGRKVLPSAEPEVRASFGLRLYVVATHAHRG